MKQRAKTNASYQSRGEDATANELTKILVRSLCGASMNAATYAGPSNQSPFPPNEPYHHRDAENIRKDCLPEVRSREVHRVDEWLGIKRCAHTGVE